MCKFDSLVILETLAGWASQSEADCHSSVVRACRRIHDSGSNHSSGTLHCSICSILTSCSERYLYVVNVDGRLTQPAYNLHIVLEGFGFGSDGPFED